MSLKVCLPGFDEHIATQGFDSGTKWCVGLFIPIIVSLALLIIGCMGAAGTFPGSSMGWATVGLSGGMALLTASGCNLSHPYRKFMLITMLLVAATLISVGALGGVGILSTTQMGWGIIGTILVVRHAGILVLDFIQARKPAGEDELRK